MSPTSSAPLALIFPLTWRRRDPVLATILYLAVLLAEYPFDGYLFQSVEAPFVGLLVMIYSLGRHADGRRLWIGLGISLVLVIARLLLGAEEGPGEAFWLVLRRDPAVPRRPRAARAHGAAGRAA